MAYMVAYLGLRDVSNDQWYLPAGLRFAALLVTPSRLWPSLFIGDVAALATFRAAMIPEYGLLYYACSSLATWPVVALVVSRLGTINDRLGVGSAADAIALIVAGLLSAELVTLANKAMLAYLKIGGGHMVYADLIGWSMGQVQGIMLALFVVALFAKGRDARPAERFFLADSLAAVALCVALVSFVLVMAPHDAGALIAMRLCLLLPAVALTFRHGWRGAAVGSIAASIALFSTIPHQEAGQVDSAGMLMQEVFAFVSASLFVLGARTHQVEKAGAGCSDEQADVLRHTREQFESHEKRQRETALRAEAMQSDSRERLGPLVTLLRKSGQAEVAMSLVGMAHTQASHFGRTVVDSIYPLTLERLGLFAALESEAFAAHFAGTAHTFDLVGRPHAISLPAKLAAYRVLGEAVEWMLVSKPQRIRVGIDCSATPEGESTICMEVQAIVPSITARSSVQTARLAQLRNRVMAYGGSLHNVPGCLSMVVRDEQRDAATASDSLPRVSHVRGPAIAEDTLTR